jgi:hypothetical protein
VNAEAGGSEAQGQSSVADELADRLIERRERLAYFLVTGATAIIAFTVTQLNPSRGLLASAPILVLSTGWLVLLFSAGASLMLIWSRHEAYRLYLDMLYGRSVESKRTEKARGKVRRWQAWALGLFFIGMAIEILAWEIALWRRF